MREARDHGKRLSDVVEATWDHLKLAKAPISYLRALLRTPVDFTHLVRRRSADGDATQARNQQRAEGQAIALQHAGRTFIDADNARQFIVGAGGDSLTIFSLTERVGRQAAGWMPSFAAALKSENSAPPPPLTSNASPAQQQALGNAPASAVPLSTVKSPVTGAVRDHIAGLRHLLKVRSAGA